MYTNATHDAVNCPPPAAGSCLRAARDCLTPLRLIGLLRNADGRVGMRRKNHSSSSQKRAEKRGGHVAIRDRKAARQCAKLQYIILVQIGDDSEA